jgi:hypothetical protein
MNSLTSTSGMMALNRTAKNTLRRRRRQKRKREAPAYESDGEESQGDRLVGDQGDSDYDSELDFLEQEVPVNTAHMLAILTVARTNPIVIACVNMILNNLMTGGLTVTIEFLGEAVKLNELHQVGLSGSFPALLTAKLHIHILTEIYSNLPGAEGL